ncbi:hypothetical protein BB934_22350 [Microvirga ossetica]|uniref:Uncharacterized protein n=1 Tax=Microvirga ossetica TaxID=1882682 RepID=A0A1B2EL02_9HYPH|nr:hypothetical protein [Microvirga ossetica]ANY80631.1 hypothetical protein BB934_22350 [Microvirga ossetica]
MTAERDQPLPFESRAGSPAEAACTLAAEVGAMLDEGIPHEAVVTYLGLTQSVAQRRNPSRLMAALRAMVQEHPDLEMRRRAALTLLLTYPLRDVARVVTRIREGRAGLRD